MTTPLVEPVSAQPPNRDAQNLFRSAVGAFPTGVALVTADAGDAGDGPVGMIVNSFTSVSLDPMLVMFCPAKSSQSWSILKNSDSYAISILADTQESLSRSFAGRRPDRFEVHDFESSADGHPVPVGAAAWFDVRRVHVDVSNGGDHELVICSVSGWSHNDRGASLVFRGGSYEVAALSRQSESAR